MNEISKTGRWLVSPLFAFVGIISWTLVAGAQPAARVGEYIIKMKSAPASSGSAKATSLKSATQKGVRLVVSLGPSMKVMGQMPESGMLHVQSVNSGDIEFLKSNPDVEFVEPNYILSIEPRDVQPYGVPPQGGDYYAQSYANVKVTDAWAQEKAYNHATPKTVVAVIDTGLSLGHGVFAQSHSLYINSVEANGSPGVDDDGDGYVDNIYGWNFFANNGNVNDDNEHGTHVAGIIVGLGMDILEDPIRESRIVVMPLKFLDASGSGSTSDAITAITYAVNHGARVINNSWGGGSYSRALHEAYTYAYNNNVVIVSAAGNSSQNLDVTPMYPAALDTPGNITVSSTTDSDNLSSFSNFSSSGLAHVAAPGSSILSTVPGSCPAPGCFKYLSGTSMAAPFVAGLAALVIREAPQLSAYQIKGIVAGSVDVKPALNGRVQTSGRVNVLTAINSAKSNAATAYWTPSYSPSYKTESRSVASEASDGGGGGCGMVKSLANGSPGGWGTSLFEILAVLSLMALPVVVARKLRVKKAERPYKRQYSRFSIAKDLQVRINDEVVNLTSSSVSVGGFSFSKELKLDKGQKIKVTLDSEEVDAEIVWCGSDRSFGVKFSSVSDAIKKEIESWTAGMVPT